jgi:hypothetical protein
MSSRLNEERIQFTSEEIETAYQEIISKIEGENKSKTIINQPKEIKGVSYS